MPDRAVVDQSLVSRLLAFVLARDARWAALESTIPADEPGGYMDCVDAEVAARSAISDDDLLTLREVKPAPRALVTISPDRQWLVALDEAGDWIIHRQVKPYTYEFHRSLDDTGQSADEVLAAFLEERGG